MDRRRVAVALVAAVAWLSAGAPVAAHAELTASEPAANSSLPAAPTELRLEFSEPIDRDTAVVDLLDARGETVGGLGEVVLHDDGHRAVVAAPDLADGVYVVRYQVLSTVDGHVTGGSFAFQVDPGGDAPPPSVAPTSSAPGADLPAALARWLALIGALVLVGSATFWLVSGRPALRQRGLVPAPSAIWWLFATASAVCLGGLALFLSLAARELPAATDGDALLFDLAAPFGDTSFATAMRVAGGGALAALVLSVARLVAARRAVSTPEDRPVRGPVAVLLVIGVIILAGFSFAGHVAALGGPPYALLDLGHLAAVAAWLGALPAVAVLYAGSLRGTDAAARRSAVALALRRHGRVALVAAPIVAITGIANSPVVLGATRNLVASEYGNLVLGKALLFSVAIGIGAVNFFLVRRLALRKLVLTIGAESAVAALAVLTAAGMLTVPVAASRADRLVTTEIPTAHLYADAEELSVHAIVTVPSPGTQSYQALVGRAVDGTPVDDLQRVFMTFVPPDGAGLAEQRVPLDAVGRPGLFETTGAYTPVVGEWRLELTIRRSGEPDASVEFALPVSIAPPPERLPPVDTGIGVPALLGYLWRFVPPSPYEWLPALALFGAAGVLWVVSPTGRRRPARARALAGVRSGIVTLGVAAALVAGSQALVVAANAGGDDVLPTDNPVPATASSVAAGALAYEATCSGCHGADGRGDGPIAAGLDVRPSDLALHVPFHTDAELYAFITRGISGTPMPGFATALTPEDRWDLVNYLRSRWPAP